MGMTQKELQNSLTYHQMIQEIEEKLNTAIKTLAIDLESEVLTWYEKVEIMEEAVNWVRNEPPIYEMYEHVIEEDMVGLGVDNEVSGPEFLSAVIAVLDL
jgi:hypothetical protein